MSTDISHAKHLIRSYFADLDNASAQNSASVLRRYVSEDYHWRGMHPFNELYGAEAVADTFLAPLKTSLTSLVRRPDIFFASTNEMDGFSSVWVASMGHFMGLFDSPFLGIAPTNKIVMLRYAEFHRIEQGKICETAFFCDILHLMLQAGLTPLPEQTGAHLVQPGPLTHDGLLYAQQDDKTGKDTLALINRMISDINSGQFSSPQEELSMCWHDDMIWWGPAGIGATFTIDRYIEQHQRPFRTKNESRKFNGHVCRMAEGHYGGFFGWPNLSLVPSGGYLGLPPSEQRSDMRGVDIYRRDGDKIAENWVFIDMLHFLKMQGIDVLSSLNS